MALNPFFLQGSQSEQRLIQELINEQLSIYGVEVAYLPRQIINKDSIFTEVQSSKFTDNFMLEAYVNNYEGYTGAGDILSKFGVSLKDELTVTISKERFEDFISPYLTVMPPSEIEVAGRPREGDLIYFPLGKRLFEIKFVEHEKPFYQLGKNYVYELKCELFELSDEIGGWDQADSVNNEIDDVLQSQGYITSLKLVSIGSTATVGVTTTHGYIRKINLIEDGYGYTKVPTIEISPPPAGGVRATAVAITTSKNNIYSIEKILIIDSGRGYEESPTITINSFTETIKNIGIVTYGAGAKADATLVTDDIGIRRVSLTYAGSGYVSQPTITFTAPTSGIGTALGIVNIDSESNDLDNIRISDAGIGYTSGTATATISDPSIISGIGTFEYNEVVTGSVSGARARVKSWNVSNLTLKLGSVNGTFVASDLIVGSTSNARYSVDYIESAEFADKYDKSEEIEKEADSIIDFSETNPFGNY
jgi:hypothetical protein